MKVSVPWLQKYFATPLPSVDAIADTLTFHVFEIEEVAGDMLDVKVLPDRAAYALSHRGIASELSAILGLPLDTDPLSAPLEEMKPTGEVTVTVCDEALVPRYMAALIRGVKVAPSPAWLKEALESVGQRSINNVVDATNYVMLNMGQPLHAFDAGKLTRKNDTYSIAVRKAYEGEKITVLTGEQYLVPEDTLLITDSHADIPIGIAGVKGGKAAEVTSETVDLLIESANFDASSVRRASQALKLFTDASLRFQNRLSPELPAYGMRDVLALITEVAGGEVVGVEDAYPAPEAPRTVSASVTRINAVLGTSYGTEEIIDALHRLSLTYTQDGETFIVSSPFTRRDLVIAEDLAEEVGRILGYDQIPPQDLPAMGVAPDQRRQRGIERIKDLLLERGYIELSTQTFAEEGEIELANPLQSDRPWLRSQLAGNMRGALERARYEAPRVLGPDPAIKLFELGTVFTDEGEHLLLALGYEQVIGTHEPAMLEADIEALIEALPEAGIIKPEHDGKIAEISLADVDLESLGEGYEPKTIVLGPYKPYSLYPFAIRDIAVWTPEGTMESVVALLIQKEAGELLGRMDLFDRFEKDGRTSYAFRLVFEAPDRTLSDADLDPIMARITESLNAQEGFDVR